MSLTPHRDAALATIEMSRLRIAELGTTDPVRAIGERMTIDTCAAILTGMGDMQDLDTSPGRIGLHVSESLASAWASVLLTFTGADLVAAQNLVSLAMDDLRMRTQRRISEAPTQGIVATAKTHAWEGRA